MEANSGIPTNTSSVTRSFGGTNSGSSSSCCMNLSPDRALPLPSSGGFRLQPRKNIPHLASPSPALGFSSSRNKGRKRGAQTMVSTTLGGSIAFPKALYPSASSAAIDIGSNEHLRSGSSRFFSTASPLQQRRGSNTADSPGFVFHAMQSMSIKSPGLSSSQQTAFRDSRETSSPFIVFSPSLNACPYNTSAGTSASTQRSRAGSFCSVDSSANAKAPRSILLTTTTPKILTTYGSPRRKATHCNKNNYNCNCNELLSTPRSCSQTATNVPVSKTPATPGSVRALPSPHATPLPRSMRLTPRSRCRGYSMSSDTSILLSPPNEKFDPSTPSKEQPVLFGGFKGGTTPSSLQQQQSRKIPYVPSPYSCSRTSVGPKEAAGGSIRVETRSLLGPQDSISNLGLSASDRDRDRAASLDCDGSLTDDDESCDNFFLTNPITLAQERDALNMPPPRPSRRRKISFHSYSEQTIQKTKIDGDCCNNTYVNANANANANAYSHTASPNQNKAPFSKHGGYKALGPNGDFWTRQVIQMKPSNSRHGQKQRNGRIDSEPSETSSSLLGLKLTEYSTMDDGDNDNERPQTPPTMLENSLSQTPSSRSSVSSVRISRSDANNVHLTIASMAAVHQQHPSPTIMACSG